ncbi:hypothetical protein Plhal710r2_c045g0148161 [Plasmopara halstedii]
MSHIKYCTINLSHLKSSHIISQVYYSNLWNKIACVSKQPYASIKRHLSLKLLILQSFQQQNLLHQLVRYHQCDIFFMTCDSLQKGRRDSASTTIFSRLCSYIISEAHSARKHHHFAILSKKVAKPFLRLDDYLQMA